MKKPHVNARCIGCCACTAIAGDTFYLNDDGLSCVQQFPSDTTSDIEDAISACPVNAISWQDADASTGEYSNGIIEHADI